MFPRIAIHTGNKVVVDNKHPNWEGFIVLQHNETTATVLKWGKNMTNKTKTRHPLLSTFQSNCQAEHWDPYTTTNEGSEEHTIFDQFIMTGQIIPPVVRVADVVEPVAH